MSGFLSLPTHTPGVFTNFINGDLTLDQRLGDLHITYDKHRVLFTLESDDGYYEGSVPLKKISDGYRGKKDVRVRNRLEEDSEKEEKEW
jgi:hypothetical protein